MAVSNQQPYVEYASNGVATVFAIPFRLIQATDLGVYLDGVEIIAGYVITGVGANSGQITFTTAPAVGTLSLIRDVPLERLTDYQTNGDLLAKTVNLDFDRIWCVLQDVGRTLGRALVRPFFKNYFDAQSYRIGNLGDPIQAQDAVTKNKLETYVADVLGSGQGNLNNAYNVAWLRTPLAYAINSVGRALSAEHINLWEFSGEITSRPDIGDPSTWDWIPALEAWAAAIQNNPHYPRGLHIPYSPGGIGISRTWLVNVSNVMIYIECDIRLTATTRQSTILFAYDANAAPAQTLKNIQVVWAKGVKVDGNGAAMTFDYYHGDGSDNHAAVRFNRVDTFVARGVHATNGPIDSFSVRQCRNWLVDDCEFSYSKEDNGFSATTDWGSYSRGDWDTYGFGSVVNCRAHHCNDVGMTAFNCSGVRFVTTKSWKNDTAYSYEDSFSAPGVKYFDGGFYGAEASQCTRIGFYLQCNGVTIDDDCSTYQIKGYAGSDPDGLYQVGVLVSRATDFYVGGKHRGNGRYGIGVFNGVAATMMGVINGEYSGNASHGIYARGINRLLIKPGAWVRGNGLAADSNGNFGDGIRVSNSGGANYLQDTGAFICNDVIIENNGRYATVCEYVAAPTICRNRGSGNSALQLSDAVSVSNASILTLQDNQMSATSGLQRYGFVISSTVAAAYAWGNRAPGSVTAEVANTSPSRKGMDIDPAISLGTWTAPGAWPSEGGWNTTSLGNSLTALADKLQRNGSLNKN